MQQIRPFHLNFIFFSQSNLFKLLIYLGFLFILNYEITCLSMHKAILDCGTVFQLKFLLCILQSPETLHLGVFI